MRKVLICIILGILAFVPMGCKFQSPGVTLSSLKAEKVQQVQISYPSRQWDRTLNNDEITSLVKLLNNVNKDTMEEYRGPNIKGGPPIITIILKSKQQIILTLNGDGFIFKEKNKQYLVNQPEFGKFLDQIYKN